MSSLACFLKDLGNTVVGSDVSDYFFTEETLKNKKINYFTFNKNNIKSTYIYIIGNAFDKNNLEVMEILNSKYEYYYYHEFIGHVLEKDLICISGTHGKTTTASFLSQMLKGNSSYIIGDGTGYGTTNTNYLVLESCEYKDHFLSYNPKIALVTNIELDHPDYFKNVEQLKNSFQMFINKTKLVVLNNDEKSTKYLKHNKIITFGFSKSSDYIIKIIKENKNGYFLNIIDKEQNNTYSCYFPFLGKHMIYDFVGGFVISLIIGQNPYVDNLKLPKRRMTIYKYGKSILIDDYAHHPTEIKCLYEAVKKTYPKLKINVIFQPHTYSRTFEFKKDFKNVLKLFDKVYLEDVFTSKREEFDWKKENELRKYFDEFDKFENCILNYIDKKKKEIWVFLGAGVINRHISYLINDNENK